MARRPSLSGLRTLGFQSKLLVMLLAVSVLSVLIAGLIGYLSGTTSLREVPSARLTASSSSVSGSGRLTVTVFLTFASCIRF